MKCSLFLADTMKACPSDTAGSAFSSSLSLSFCLIKRFHPISRIVRPEVVNSVPLHRAVSFTASYLSYGAVAHISFVAIRVRIFLSPAGREAVSVEAILLVGIMA